MNTISLKNPTNFRINEHNLSSLSRDFQKNAFVEIPNFLVKEFADECYEFYFNKMPEDWFKVAFWPNPNGESPKIQNYWEDTSVESSNSFKVFNEGRFSYHFHRTVDDHNKNCPCYECVIRKFFASYEMTSFLSELTSKEITSPSGQFTSWYKKGNFLSAHHDENNGKIGVILDFAKNWSPVFGGNLYLLEDNWFDVKKVIVPKFNNLKVFDIPEEKNGVPHFVSTVIANDLPDRKRIAFGGWYK